VEPIRFGVTVSVYSGGGLLVEDVLEGHAGQRGGLRRGDVILALNGRAVTTLQEYSDAVDTAGRMMLVTLRRTGSANPITIAVPMPMPE